MSADLSNRIQDTHIGYRNTRSPPLSENLNYFRKRMVFSVLGSLRTVSLHSALAVHVNNLGLKFVS